MYKLEKNVPIPMDNIKVGRKTRFPLDVMLIGDSFVVEVSEYKALLNAVRYITKKTGKRFIVRKFDISARVWRVTQGRK